MTLYLPEIQAKILLPLIRKELAIQLKKRNKSQKDIGELLGTTQASISLYLNEKRAKFSIPEKTKKEIQEFLKNDNLSKEVIAKFVLKLCDKSLEEGILCQLHEKYEKVPENCDLCFRKD